MRLRFFLFASFLAFFAPRPLYAQETPEFRGPIGAENARPFQAIFLHFRPESPETLAPHRQKWGISLSLANNLLIPNVGPNGERVEEDFETQTLLVSYRRGISKNLEIGADLPLVARNGGVLDAPISLYHCLLGLGGNGEDNPTGRDNRSRGRSILSFQNANGQGINQGNALGLGDAVFSLKTPLTRGKFASAVRGAVKIPTGSANKILGSGGTDFGLGFDARYAFSPRFALSGYGALSRFGEAEAVLDARKTGVQGGLGLEYRGRRASYLAQTDAATRNVRTGNPFADRTPVIVTLGIKKPMGRDKLLWAAFSENGDYHNFHAPFFGNIGPDFTLSAGLEWRR